MWWDTLEHKIRQKHFSDEESFEAEEDAHEFAKKCKVVEEDYRLTVSVKYILKNIVHYQYRFRIGAQIKEYTNQEVPLDAYILSTWLGDGTTGCPWSSNIDENILTTWRDWANERGMQFLKMNNAGKDTDSLCTWSVTFPNGSKKKIL